MSKVSFGSHGPVCFSVHLSGIMNGFTHVIALAGEASAVAVAVMSTEFTPNIDPSSVGTAVPRVPVRYTCTLTRFDCPVGLTGNVTSPPRSDGAFPMTVFDRAVLIALCTAGPLGDPAVQRFASRPTTPDMDPATEAFCA